jgi:hypothetical protein
MDALVRLCHSGLTEALLSQMMQSKISTMFVDTFDIADILRIIKVLLFGSGVISSFLKRTNRLCSCFVSFNQAEKEKMTDFSLTFPPASLDSPSHPSHLRTRHYIAASWTELPPETVSSGPITCVNSFIFAKFIPTTQTLEIITSSDITGDTSIVKSSFYEVLRGLLRKVHQDYPSLQQSTSAVSPDQSQQQGVANGTGTGLERMIQVDVPLPSILREGLVLNETGVMQVFFMAPTYRHISLRVEESSIPTSTSGNGPAILSAELWQEKTLKDKARETGNAMEGVEGGHAVDGGKGEGPPFWLKLKGKMKNVESIIGFSAGRALDTKWVWKT